MSVRILFEDESAEGFARLAVPVTSDALQTTFLAVSRAQQSLDVRSASSEAVALKTIPPAGTILRLSLDDLDAMKRRLTAREEEVWGSSLLELVERLLTCDFHNLSLLQPVNDFLKIVLEQIAFHLGERCTLDDNRLYLLELIFGKSE